MSKGKGILSNVIWRFAERVGAQGVTFIVSIVLARKLDPEMYGIVALITVFTSILCIFVDSGMNVALIQKKEIDNIDYSVVFFFNIIMGVVMYVMLFISAPYIEKFYGYDNLVPCIRVMGLQLIISGIRNVQQAYVTRNMLFRRFFFSTLAGTIAAAIVGIYMAYAGVGVWALITQNLVNLSVDVVVLWITVKWRPQFTFSIYRLRLLFSFGWKLLAANIFDSLFNNFRQLVIGKFFSSQDLAFYNRGRQWPVLIANTINTSVDTVMLPVMARSRDNITQEKLVVRKMMRTSIYIISPMMIGLAVCAEPVVKIILTEKWLSCVPYLRIFCIYYMFYPILTANMNAFNANGRSDLFLKVLIGQRAIEIIVLIIVMKYGVFAIACSLLLTAFTNQIICMIPTKLLLRYPMYEQLKDIMPTIALAVIMGVMVYFIGMINWDYILVLQFFSGVIIYLIGSKLLRLDSYYYIMTKMRSTLIKFK